MKRLMDKMSRIWRSVFYLLGLEGLLYNQKKDGDLILMFHNVLPKTNHHINLRNFGVDEFERIIRYVGKHYQIVPLSEMLNSDGRGKRVSITFDDGLVNNLRHALPVLDKHKVPATFFICTSWLHGISSLWPDTLNRLLLQAGAQFEWNHRIFERTFRNQFREKNSGIKLEEILLNSSQENVDDLIQTLIKKNGYDPSHDLTSEDEWKVMKGEEVKILSENPLVTIGSHAISHRNLVHLVESAVKEEMTESKAYLERVTGKKIECVSFPFGEYNDVVLKSAVEAGYKCFIGVRRKEGIQTNVLKVVSRMGLYNDSTVTENLHAINSYFE